MAHFSSRSLVGRTIFVLVESYFCSLSLAERAKLAEDELVKVKKEAETAQQSSQDCHSQVYMREREEGGEGEEKDKGKRGKESEGDGRGRREGERRREGRGERK